ncbi:MAG: sigma-70 family RNA polymerase sigma factor [Bacteroidales bacterium]|nr:sigma-70 family RNA polymerase sigma factor [Bacteroidales bacterium]
MTISNINRLDQFKLDCKIINLKYEYTGYKDDVQWAIVTELSEEEILQKYPEEIKPYVPFIRLSVSQGEVFEEGTRYENKCRMREVRTGCSFDISDEEFAKYHHELIVNDTEESLVKKEELKMLEKALSTLSDVQRSRIYKHFFLQMTYSEISKEEGVNRSSIRESIEQTLKKLKKFYE